MTNYVTVNVMAYLEVIFRETKCCFLNVVLEEPVEMIDSHQLTHLHLLGDLLLPAYPYIMCMASQSIPPLVYTAQSSIIHKGSSRHRLL